MQRVSVGRILKNDYGAFLSACFGFVFLGISVYIAASGKTPVFNRLRHSLKFAAASWVSFAVMVILMALFFILLAKRIAHIRRILETGPRTFATVTGIYFDRDRGRIDYQYMDGGQKYTSGTAIMKNKQTKEIAVGDEIEVAIDPRNSKKALILFLYLTPST